MNLRSASSKPVPADWLMQFRKRLVSARISCRLERGDLSKRLKTPVSTITRWENGDRLPSLYALCQIAEALGKTPHDLLPPLAKPATTAYDSPSRCGMGT